MHTPTPHPPAPSAAAAHTGSQTADRILQLRHEAEQLQQQLSDSQAAAAGREDELAKELAMQKRRHKQARQRARVAERRVEELEAQLTQAQVQAAAAAETAAGDHAPGSPDWGPAPVGSASPPRDACAEHAEVIVGWVRRCRQLEAALEEVRGRWDYDDLLAFAEQCHEDLEEEQQQTAELRRRVAHLEALLAARAGPADAGQGAVTEAAGLTRRQRRKLRRRLKKTQDTAEQQQQGPVEQQGPSKKRRGGTLVHAV